MFSINYRDPRPIYEQVKDSLRRDIITGVLKPDEKVPSVRDAAGELAINPNTIQKAYRELEAEGYIYSVAGKGSFVAECTDAREIRKRELYKMLDKLIEDILHVGETKESVCAHIMQSDKEAEK